MRKVTLDRQTLGQEMRLAAIKGIPFNYLLRNLRRDYDASLIENSALLGKLDEAYNTMCFMASERKVKYNMVG
jgi:hypothetical protein